MYTVKVGTVCKKICGTSEPSMNKTWQLINMIKGQYVEIDDVLFFSYYMLVNMWSPTAQKHLWPLAGIILVVIYFKWQKIWGQ